MGTKNLADELKAMASDSSALESDIQIEDRLIYDKSNSGKIPEDLLRGSIQPITGDRGKYVGLKGRSRGTIHFNPEMLRENQQKLKQAANEVNSIWSSIKNEQINQISSSWAGKDAEQYIQKVTNFDSKVQAAVESLELLSKTFDKAANALSDAQQRIKGSIDSF